MIFREACRRAAAGGFTRPTPSLRRVGLLQLPGRLFPRRQVIALRRPASLAKARGPGVGRRWKDRVRGVSLRWGGAWSAVLWLVVAGCGLRCPHGTATQEASAWLEAHALPQESVAAPARLRRCFGDREVLDLPGEGGALDILAWLAEERPDYLLAPRGVAWDGARAQPWFIERYRELAVWQPAIQPDEALTLFGYSPSPFDAGERVPMETQFESEAVVLTAYRLDGPHVAPDEPLHVTLEWDAVPGQSYGGLRTRVSLVEVSTGLMWARSDVRLEPRGLLPWDDGARLAARYLLDPPDDLPQGTYYVTVALEEPTGRRVPLAGREETDLRIAVVERPPDVSRAPIATGYAANYTFGTVGEVALIGYDVPDRVAPGDALRVALLFKASSPVVESYSVFVHLLTDDGTLVTQDDGVPVFGFYPTDDWVPGDYVRDQRLLVLPEELGRGDYAISVGLYRPETRERWHVADAAGEALPDARVLLHTVKVR